MMKKVLTGLLGSVLLAGVMCVTADAQVVPKTKHYSKVTYKKGRYVTKTTWRHGKRVTTRVWVTGNRWGHKVVHKTKDVMMGSPKKP